VIVGDVAPELLLILKIAFLVLLYLFIWRMVRAAAREVRSTQESIVLTPQQAASAGLTPRRSAPVPAPAPPPPAARLVVVRSPAYRPGEEFPVDSVPLTAGRGGQNEVALPNDEFASARHARFEPRADDVWVVDLGSTNGTFVNGMRVEREQRLAHGDVVRVGETELRYER
jgi:hypothetical protein